MDNRQSDYGWTDVGHWVHLARMRKLQKESKPFAFRNFALISYPYNDFGGEFRSMNLMVHINLLSWSTSNNLKTCRPLPQSVLHHKFMS